VSVRRDGEGAQGSEFSPGRSGPDRLHARLSVELSRALGVDGIAAGAGELGGHCAALVSRRGAALALDGVGAWGGVHDDVSLPPAAVRDRVVSSWPCRTRWHDAV